MRELKFRVYGGLLKKEFKAYDNVLISMKDGELKIKPCDWHGRGDDVVIEQYTGLKDKNGKEIYEGDIVKLTGKVAQNKSTIYKVVWDSFLTGYDLISLEPSKSDVGYLNETEIKNRYEVIGNIHDNPELLKKEK